jgi:hypothetical protein
MRMTGSELVFEAVIASLETVRQFLDDPEPNDAFSINGIDVTRDCDIRKLL